MRVMNMSIQNEKNISYLYSIYMTAISEGLRARSFQIYPSRYLYPTDIIQQDSNMRMQNVIKRNFMDKYDLYIFFGEFNNLTDIYKIKNDIEAPIVPYFFTEGQIITCLNSENKDLIENAKIIFIRQPHLKMYLEDYDDKVVYLNSPCSVNPSDTSMRSDDVEYIIPDAWTSIGSFTRGDVYGSAIAKAQVICDDKMLGYIEINKKTRGRVLSILSQLDVMIDSHNSEFYSQAAIESGMMGIPTITSVNAALEEYVKDSPFILTDSQHLSEHIVDAIENNEDHKNNTAYNKFFERHEPKQASAQLLRQLKKMDVI